MRDYDPRGERATRDIVSRGDVRRDARRAARRRNGGVYISMAHLGPENVRQQVQGHGRALRRLRLRSRRRPGRGRADRALHDGRRGVRARLHAPRCRASSSRARTPAACTAPTAWAATAWPTRPCSAASPATRWRRGLAGEGACRARCRRARRSGGARAAPFRRSAGAGDLEAIRERLYQVMWDDVGILRTPQGLARARAALADLAAQLDAHAASAGARPRLQSDLARLAQSRQSRHGEPRDLRAARRRARGFARRALPRGLSRARASWRARATFGCASAPGGLRASRFPCALRACVRGGAACCRC